MPRDWANWIIVPPNFSLANAGDRCNTLALWHRETAVMIAFAVCLNSLFQYLFVKKTAEVVCRTEYFSNFVLGDYSYY